MLAPIVLIIYNRPEHAKKTLEALKKNYLAKDSELFIFSDAPKNELAIKPVKEVKAYIKTVAGFKNVTITEREENWGLAKSIITGVTDIVNQFGKVIVLEDDIVTSPYFLNYMNDALNLYENEEKVMHISGYFFPIKNNLPETFFYNQTSCWGWATWKRAWKYFNQNANDLLEKIKKEDLYRFNIDGSYDFFDHLLANVDGRLNTWAIKWHTSVFLKNGLCLHPKTSLVKNIGFDLTGINCSDTIEFNTQISNKPVQIKKNPLIESEEARQLVKKYNLSKKPSLINRILNKIKKLIKTWR